MKRVEKGDMVLFINGNRDGYSPEQCDRTMTVGELIEFLSDFNDDTLVMMKNDNGYTYGSIGYVDFEDEVVFDDEESED